MMILNKRRTDHVQIDLLKLSKFIINLKLDSKAK